MGRSKELTPQLRSRICELRSLGYTYSRIHKLHPEVPLGTISSTIRREALRDDNESQKRPGRPRKLTEEQRDQIYDIVMHQNPNITHRELLESIDSTIKERALQMLLKDLGMCKRPLKPSLKKA